MVTSVCVDSRLVTPGALFFALSGEHTDGHRYVAQALKAGAVAAVVEAIEGDALEEIGKEGMEGAQIVVPATLRALGDLARHYRHQFAIPIIGVTGSVGKTSTKEMIAAVLRTGYVTLASAKNYNNEIGVPLTLFNLENTHQAAVVEMGMRGAGEIDYLAGIAQPTIGVITNTGYAHIERLGTLENIARAKAELFARLPHDGAAIFAEHNWPIITQQIPEGCRKITFAMGSSEDFVPVSIVPGSLQIRENGAAAFDVEIAPVNTEFSIKLPVQYSITLLTPGAHHVPNALTALAVAYALEIPMENAISALETWKGAEGRMVVRHTFDDIIVLDDCYNASPESMAAALDTLFHMAPNGVAVLGDMRELGDFAESTHREIGSRLLLSSTRLLVTIGPLAGHIADVVEAANSARETFGSVIRFANAAEALDHINTLVKPGDTVLVKGSRAMGMEILVNALTGEQGSDPHA